MAFGMAFNSRWHGDKGTRASRKACHSGHWRGPGYFSCSCCDALKLNSCTEHRQPYPAFSFCRGLLCSIDSASCAPVRPAAQMAEPVVEPVPQDFEMNDDAEYDFEDKVGVEKDLSVSNLAPS